MSFKNISALYFLLGCIAVILGISEALDSLIPKQTWFSEGKLDQGLLLNYKPGASVCVCKVQILFELCANYHILSHLGLNYSHTPTNTLATGLHGNSVETGYHGNSLSPLGTGRCWELMSRWRGLRSDLNVFSTVCLFVKQKLSQILENLMKD